MFQYFMVLSDWRNVAAALTLFFLIIRVLLPTLYRDLYLKLKFNFKFALLSFGFLCLMITREFIITPFSWIPINWPTLTFFQQVLLFLDTTHFRSIFFFGFLIILLWRKYGFLFPALAVGWFCIGVVELTFIPQHYINIPGRFLGWDWYYPFIVITAYFLVIRKCFRFTWKFALFFAAAIFTQYFLLLFYPFWLLQYAQVGFGFTINYNVLPTPPIETWIFWFLNHFMKVLFTIAFYFVELTKHDVK